MKILEFEIFEKEKYLKCWKYWKFESLKFEMWIDPYKLIWILILGSIYIIDRNCFEVELIWIDPYEFEMWIDMNIDIGINFILLIWM